MQERNLCSQSNPYQYLCGKGMLHKNKREIEGPNMKILSLQKKKYENDNFAHTQSLYG